MHQCSFANAKIANSFMLSINRLKIHLVALNHCFFVWKIYFNNFLIFFFFQIFQLKLQSVRITNFHVTTRDAYRMQDAVIRMPTVMMEQMSRIVHQWIRQKVGSNFKKDSIG
jgi:hypothetical protein